MRFFNKISLILILTLAFSNLSAKDFYCSPTGNNGNPGTIGSPLAAFSTVSWSTKGVSAGDNIYLMDGNHGAAIVSNVLLTNYVTVKPAPGHNNAYLKSVWLKNCKYWSFDGVKIDGTGNINSNPPISAPTNATGVVEYLFRANTTTSYIKIVNTEIQSIDNIDSWTKNDWYQKVLNGVWLRGHHSTVENNVIKNVYHALEIGVFGDDSVVRGNLIDNFAADGIRGLGNRCTYEDNVVQNCYINDYEIQHDDAFQCYGINASTYKRKDIVLRNNKFLLWNKAAPADMSIIGDLMQGIINTDGHADNWIVENNLVVNHQAHGISLYGGINSRVQNNTVVRNHMYPHDAGREPRVYIDDQGKSGQVQANHNNIIRNNVCNVLTTWTFDATSTVENNLDIDASILSNITDLFNDYANNNFVPKLTGGLIDTGVNTNLTATDIAGHPRLVDGDANGTATVDIGSYEYGMDNIPPTFVADDTYYNYEFTIKYNEAVTKVTAENISNYSLDNGGSLLTATLSADNVTVLFTTAPLNGNLLYTLTSNNVEDINGNKTVNETDTFTYLCDVVSASSYQDDAFGTNPPEFAFDGDLATKWAADGAADGAVEWIQKNLCSEILLESVEIAFQNGHTRMYDFIIEVSTDGKTFTQIYSGTSNGSSEALELFDVPDTQAKYIKITGSGSNANNWNNYFEIVFNEKVVSVPTNVVIVASPADGYVSTTDSVDFSPNPMAAGYLMVGFRSRDVSPGVTSTTEVSTIIPFKLPARSGAGVRVSGAQLKIYVPFGREWANKGIDLYGLKYSNVSDAISADDHYSGNFALGGSAGNGDVLEYGIEEDVISKNNILGVKDLSRYEISIDQDALAAYINAQYDAGAVDGDWIFLRLSLGANSPLAIGYQHFVIDGADGSSVDHQGTVRADTHPAELHLDYLAKLPQNVVTTWSGGTWSNGVPNRNIKAVISEDITVGGATPDIDNIIAKSIDVNTGFTLTVKKNSNVAIYEDVHVITGAKIIVESGASFKKINDAVGDITIETGAVYIVKRTGTASADDYTYWSSPVSTTIESSFIASGSPRAYTYVTENYNDIDDDGYDDESVDFIASDNSTNSVHYGDYTVAVKMPNTSTPFPTDTVGWNLVGNPFSSALRISSFINDNGLMLYSTVYFWTHSAGVQGNGQYDLLDYASYNKTGGVSTPSINDSNSKAPTGFIASGQGFFVGAKQAGNITFKSSTMQLLTAYDEDNNVFFKNKQVAEELFIGGDTIVDRLWLGMSSEGVRQQILVGFLDGASDGIDDGYDGMKMRVGNDLTFYSKIKDREFSIQGKPKFRGDETITLGFDAVIDNETSYSIEIDNTEGIFSNRNVDVILKDKLLGVSHDLRKTEYKFDVESAGTYDDRFEVSFVSETLSEDNNYSENIISVYPNPVVDGFMIYNNVEVQNIRVYDVNGIVVKIFENNTEYDISNLSPGMYILSITSTNGSVKVEKILKK